MTSDECVQCETVKGTEQWNYVHRFTFSNGKLKGFQCTCDYHYTHNGYWSKINDLQCDFENICSHILPILVMHTVHSLHKLKKPLSPFVRILYDTFRDKWNIKDINENFASGGGHFREGTIPMKWQEWRHAMCVKETPEYTVKLKNKKLRCSCLGFKYHKKCKHLKIIEERKPFYQNRRELGISLATLVLQ
jgi:hypothetical protein